MLGQYKYVHIIYSFASRVSETSFHGSLTSEDLVAVQILGCTIMIINDTIEQTLAIIIKTIYPIQLGGLGNVRHVHLQQQSPRCVS